MVQDVDIDAVLAKPRIVMIYALGVFKTWLMTPNVAAMGSSFPSISLSDFVSPVIIRVESFLKLRNQ